jgi:hypothetical protein
VAWILAFPLTTGAKTYQIVVKYGHLSARAGSASTHDVFKGQDRELPQMLKQPFGTFTFAGRPKCLSDSRTRKASAGMVTEI